jgi:hypothetical protein
MRLRNLALVVASGLASFLAVGVLVTELATPYIEFSLFVGLPVGLLAGVAVAAIVAVGLGPAAGPGRRRPALALGTFGVTFLVVLFGAAGGFETGTVVALILASVLGLVAAVAVYLQAGRGQAAGAVADRR